MDQNLPIEVIKPPQPVSDLVFDRVNKNTTALVQLCAFLCPQTSYSDHERNYFSIPSTSKQEFIQGARGSFEFIFNLQPNSIIVETTQSKVWEPLS